MAYLLSNCTFNLNNNTNENNNNNKIKVWEKGRGLFLVQKRKKEKKERDCKRTYFCAGVHMGLLFPWYQCGWVYSPMLFKLPILKTDKVHKHSDFLICSDFNIDLLNYDLHRPTRNYVDFIRQNNIEGNFDKFRHKSDPYIGPYIHTLKTTLTCLIDTKWQHELYLNWMKSALSESWFLWHSR